MKVTARLTGLLVDWLGWSGDHAADCAGQTERQAVEGRTNEKGSTATLRALLSCRVHGRAPPSRMLHAARRSKAKITLFALLAILVTG
jgi:hypothetical protein